MLEKKAIAIAHAPSFQIGAQLLEELGGIQISARGLGKTSARLGGELIAIRDAKTQRYFDQSLPRKLIAPDTPIALACVSIDGGRMQTRDEGGGPGVHNPHWRETKNALFMRMSGVAFDEDPHPDLPSCFADCKSMKDLLCGLAASAESIDSPADQDADVGSATTEDKLKWRPERLFRTCISSLCDSDTFGKMMQAEADSRGFYKAAKQAFVSDGLPYNWTIAERRFPNFTPILDFVHAVERVHEASRTVHENTADVWTTYVRWARLCWRGKVCQVIAELRSHQPRVGVPPEGCEKTDPRKLLADAIGYLTNNQSRMNYPRYRREGLPVTSAHMESFVKEINQRVKGTEKFWDDGASGEAILQIRAAALCDDNRLGTFLANRPGHPFHTNVPRLQLGA